MTYDNTNNRLELKYNTEREPLVIPEYGRQIQDLINYITTIEDKEERNKAAHAVIKIMGAKSPHLRDIDDFNHVLWDQLFLMSGFKLDVDSPYPIPNSETLTLVPNKITYPQKEPKYRFYGNNILKMIEGVLEIEEGEKKEALIMLVANHMKKSYLSWNKETVEDEVIFQHLLELSGGKINLLKKEENLSNTNDLIRINKKQDNKFNLNSNQNNNNQKFRNNNNQNRNNRKNTNNNK